MVDTNNEAVHPQTPLEDFYPIPYFKDLIIRASQGTVFRFDNLKHILPEDEWLKLDDKARLRNVLDVIQE